MFDLPKLRGYSRWQERDRFDLRRVKIWGEASGRDKLLRTIKPHPAYRGQDAPRHSVLKPFPGQGRGEEPNDGRQVDRH